MTEEILLTEELFLEFLDPVSAKAYTWKQETESGYASLKFQASFEDDHEKRYYLSFYRDSGFGKNSRRVIFSVKKNKNLNPKIHVDKGSFIKILGTIIQIYQHYKLNDPDGKLSNSYAFQFPDTFAKYMPFLAKVIKRLFKSTPKIRLELYGAVESLDGNTIIYLANTSSSMPLFGGPKADLAVIRGDFYMKLTGQTAANKEDEGSVVDDTIQGVPPLPKASAPAYIPPAYKATKKAKVKDEPIAKPFEEPTKVEPVKEVPKASNIPDSFIPPKVISPEKFKSKVGNKPSTAIYATKDSGSSSLLKGQTAEIVGLYHTDEFIMPKVKQQFGINPVALKKIEDSGEFYTLVVKAKNGKYVAFPVGIEATFPNYVNDKFFFIENSDVKVPEPTKSELDKYATNPFAAVVNTLPESFEKILDEAHFNLGPIKISLGADTSLIGVADKLEETRKFFGNLPKDKVKEYINNISAEVDNVTSKLTKSLNVFFSEGKVFLGDKEGEYTNYISSVKIYTGSGYEAINNFLRGKGEQTASTKQSLQNRVNEIDEAFSKEGVRLPRQLVVYRGASASMEQIKSIQEANSIPLTGYASVSLRPSIGLAFMGSGHYFNDLLIPTMKVNDPTNTDPVEPTNFSSSQGNKILYSINHLDRCLSLLLKKISNHPNEEEILLNRGTEVRSRPGTAIQRVMKRASGDPESGIWMARVEIAPKAISESSLKNFLLREAVEKATEAQDCLALTSFFLQDYKEFIS